MRPSLLILTSSFALGSIFSAPLCAQGLDLSLQTQYSLDILGPGGSAFDDSTGSLWVSDGAGPAGSAVPPGTNRVLEVDPFTGTTKSVFLASVIPGLIDGPDAVALHPGTGDMFLFNADGGDAAGRVTQGGALVQSFPSGHNITGAAFCADGSLRVVRAFVSPPTLWEFDTASGQLKNPLPLVGTSDAIMAADFDPATGNILLSAPSSRTLLEVDPATGQILSATDVSPWVGNSGPTSLSFNADGSYLFLGNAYSHAPNRMRVLKRCLPASWSVYGQGYPGTLGVPAISASSAPVIGTSTSVQIGNSAGVNTMALVIAGGSQVLVPGGWGGSLLVAPQAMAALLAPTTGLTLPWVIPPDPSLCGLCVFAQALLADAGAPAGVSNTAGLKLILGN
ncbi:MAG: hypothetical protein HY812_07735 [Planctomycetes bacterium]|nr:hypothetical protein [Planctomycetota bacterium]